MTIGKQTEGGRAANGEAESEEEEGMLLDSVDDEGPYPDRTETAPGVDIFVGVPVPDATPLDPDDPTEPSVESNPPAGTIEPIRGGSVGSDFVSCAATPTSTFPVIIALGTVVNGPPSAGVLQSDADLRGETRGTDVSGGGNGPMPLLTLRLSGGSSGVALSFFLEPLLVLSLPLAGTAADADWA